LSSIFSSLCVTRTDTTHAATSAPTRQCITAAATSHVHKWSRAQSAEGLWQGARQLVVVELEIPATHSLHTSRITTDTTSTVGSQCAAATSATVPSYHTAAARRHEHSQLLTEGSSTAPSTSGCSRRDHSQRGRDTCDAQRAARWCHTHTHTADHDTRDVSATYVSPTRSPMRDGMAPVKPQSLR
jgi:hypothetical protein